MYIINSIAPIFLLIALGKILRKTSFFPEDFFKGLNRLVFWFALPALLVAIPVVFQPELRRALERLGRTGSFLARYQQDEVVE